MVEKILTYLSVLCTMYSVCSTEYLYKVVNATVCSGGHAYLTSTPATPTQCFSDVGFALHSPFIYHKMSRMQSFFLDYVCTYQHFTNRSEPEARNAYASCYSGPLEGGVETAATGLS